MTAFCPAITQPLTEMDFDVRNKYFIVLRPSTSDLSVIITSTIYGTSTIY